jgi:hypothetical protein
MGNSNSGVDAFLLGIGVELELPWPGVEFKWSWSWHFFPTPIQLRLISWRARERQKKLHRCPQRWATPNPELTLFYSKLEWLTPGVAYLWVDYTASRVRQMNRTNIVDRFNHKWIVPYGPASVRSCYVSIGRSAFSYIFFLVVCVSWLFEYIKKALFRLHHIWGIFKT